ncbi:hypothetical protein DdX_10662 [Ditylenchus destructor]|uniref:Uncharacterized protein n=1 Tax=Ditylenchus destructor TaxID=166010 RepID=A0AAD4MYV4_9BILA|nr:hypothetical protein DdX_10662 [Ditylenchus destructor]
MPRISVLFVFPFIYLVTSTSLSDKGSHNGPSSSSTLPENVTAQNSFIDGCQKSLTEEQKSFGREMSDYTVRLFGFKSLSDVPDVNDTSVKRGLTNLVAAFVANFRNVEAMKKVILENGYFSIAKAVLFKTPPEKMENVLDEEIRPRS